MRRRVVPESSLPAPGPRLRLRRRRAAARAVSSRIGIKPPCRCEAITARTLGPNASATAARSRFQSSGATSTKTGCADGVNREKIAGIVVGGEYHLIAGADLEGAKGEFDRQRTAGADGGMGDAVFARNRSSNRSTAPPWYLPHDPSRHAACNASATASSKNGQSGGPSGRIGGPPSRAGGGSAGFIGKGKGVRNLFGEK